MRLTNISISKKLGLAFAIIVLGAACMGFVVYENVRVVEDAGLQSEAHASVLALAVEARMALSRQENTLRGYLLSHNDRRIASLATHHATFRKHLAQIREATSGDPQIGADLDRVDASIQGWHEEIAEKAIAASRDPATSAQATDIVFSDAADGFIEPAEKIIDAIRDREKQGSQDIAAKVASANRQTQRALLAGIGTLVALSSLLGWLSSRMISKPLVRLRDVMRRLAEGDKAVEIPFVDRGDEIGQMAGSVLFFRQAAIQQAQLEAEAVSTRQSQEHQRTCQAAIDNAKAEDLRSFVHTVEKGFDALSTGDLTVRMNDAVATEFEPIRAKFNTSVEKLEAALGGVISGIATLRTGLTEISVASGDLAQRTEQQAANLEETVAALSEVARGVSETADGAHRAQVAAASAQKNAGKGEEIVGRAVAAMSDIERSSVEIAKIIGVIDEIAFQTNLLALNAGVEAARAGEAGRGFAVVAQEVRGLAQRSAGAAKEIKDLISTSSTQVGRGVDLVTATGRSLAEIVAQIAEMSAVVATIANSAKEQASSLRGVSTAADQMDKVTQQNAAMVEETTAAAQTLTNETAQLSRLTERFRTAADGGRLPRPVAVPAPAIQRATALVSRLKHMGAGGTAPKLVASQDDWEEF